MMLSKKQLEEMIKCNEGSPCKDCSFLCEDRCTASDEIAAKTALEYREVLEQAKEQIELLSQVINGFGCRKNNDFNNYSRWSIQEDTKKLLETIDKLIGGD